MLFLLGHQRSYECIDDRDATGLIAGDLGESCAFFLGGRWGEGGGGGLEIVTKSSCGLGGHFVRLVGYTDLVSPQRCCPDSHARAKCLSLSLLTSPAVVVGTPSPSGRTSRPPLLPRPPSTPIHPHPTPLHLSIPSTAPFVANRPSRLRQTPFAKADFHLLERAVRGMEERAHAMPEAVRAWPAALELRAELATLREAVPILRALGARSDAPLRRSERAYLCVCCWHCTLPVATGSFMPCVGARFVRAGRTAALCRFGTGAR